MAPRKKGAKASPPGAENAIRLRVGLSLACPACSWNSLELDDPEVAPTTRCPECSSDLTTEIMEATYRCPECSGSAGIVAIACGPGVAPLCRACIDRGLAVRMILASPEGSAS